MSTHSIAQPISHLEAAAGRLYWGRDLRDWVRSMQNISQPDRDQRASLRAARAIMEAALADIRPLIAGETDEAAKGNEALRED